MDGRRVECDLGVARSWGAGPEVLFLSNPLADPVGWSAPVRSDLVAAGYRVTTFDPRPQDHDWQSVVGCVDAFIRRGADSVALVGWSQGAAVAQEVALRAEAHVGAPLCSPPTGDRTSWTRSSRRHGNDSCTVATTWTVSVSRSGC